MGDKLTKISARTSALAPGVGMALIMASGVIASGGIPTAEAATGESLSVGIGLIGQSEKIDVNTQKLVKLSIKKNDLICGANNDGEFSYLHNQSSMTLEVTIKAAETGRKFPRKRKYVMQPDQEVRIGCTKSAYKQDVEFTYTLFKIKRTNYLQQRKF